MLRQVLVQTFPIVSLSTVADLDLVGTGYTGADVITLSRF